MPESQIDIVNKELLNKLKKIIVRNYTVKTDNRLVKRVIYYKGMDIGIFKSQ